MIRIDEFNIKDLKFLKIKKSPEADLKRAEIALGFLSYLYSKLLGQLVDKKGNIGIFYGKSINANYSEYIKKKRVSSDSKSFELSDFKYPFLGLVFYRQSPDTIIDADDLTLEYFRNIYIKYVKPQKALKPYNFYNYFYLYTPELIQDTIYSDAFKLIKPTANPKYKNGKIDLTTVFISNYLLGNFKKEFKVAIEEIKAFAKINSIGSNKKNVKPEVKKEEPGEEPNPNLTKQQLNNLEILKKKKEDQLKASLAKGTVVNKNKLTPEQQKEIEKEDELMGKPIEIDLKKPLK